jgi:hypothetical protein
MIVFGLTTKISSTKVGDFFCSNAARVCAPAAGAMELGLQRMTLQISVLRLLNYF